MRLSMAVTMQERKRIRAVGVHGSLALEGKQGGEPVGRQRIGQKGAQKRRPNLPETVTFLPSLRLILKRRYFLKEPTTDHSLTHSLFH